MRKHLTARQPLPLDSASKIYWCPNFPGWNGLWLQSPALTGFPLILFVVVSIQIEGGSAIPPLSNTTYSISWKTVCSNHRHRMQQRPSSSTWCVRRRTASVVGAVQRDGYDPAPGRWRLPSSAPVAMFRWLSSAAARAARRDSLPSSARPPWRPIATDSRIVMRFTSSR